MTGFSASTTSLAACHANAILSDMPVSSSYDQRLFPTKFLKGLKFWYVLFKQHKDNLFAIIKLHVKIANEIERQISSQQHQST
eukprot:scaffold176821_cov46-Prasinocladus_malaysianus.AAC.1